MRRVPLLVILILTLMWSGANGQTVPPKRTWGGVISDEYIVLLKDRSRDPADVGREHANRYEATLRYVYRSAVRGYSARVPKSRLESLRRDPDVAGITPNVKVKASVQTIGTGVNRIGPNLSGLKGTSIDVAVIDSGIDVDHPDLQANIAGGVSCIAGDPSYDDKTPSGHGTHVSGIIAAVDNTIGVRGVAPEADIWAIRVFGTTESTTLDVILCGVDWADVLSVGNGGPVTLANMSIEAFIPGLEDDDNCGFTEFDALHQAICALVAHGVTVVVAAGNSGEEIAGPMFADDIIPAAYDEVITASALADSDGAPCGDGPGTGAGADDTFATFSNYAPLAEDQEHMLAGPGVNILSTVPGGITGLISGTSQAAPHVTGIAALFQETMPGAPPAQVKQALLAVAEPKEVDFNGECEGTGFSHDDPAGDYPEPLARDGNWEIPLEAATPGVVRGNLWFLNNAYAPAGNGPSFGYGKPSDRIVVGDWNNDGIDTPGVVRGNVWYLNNDFDATGDVPSFAYGNPSDRIVVGDWDGVGGDSPGVVRGNVWYLNNQLDGSGHDEPSFAYGNSTDWLLAGDWDGDGFDSPGVVRGNIFYLNNDFDGSGDVPSVAFGNTTDRKMAGDWDGDGDDDVAVRRGSTWFLRLPTSPVPVLFFAYGRSTDRPVVGDWDGDGP